MEMVGSNLNVEILISSSEKWPHVGKSTRLVIVIKSGGSRLRKITRHAFSSWCILLELTWS